MSKPVNTIPVLVSDTHARPTHGLPPLVRTGFPILGCLAFLAAAYSYGHTEFVCFKVSRDNVNASFTVYHWFDLMSYDEFELAGVKSASVYPHGSEQILIDTGGELPSGHGRFAGDLPTAVRITELKLNGRVGQKIVITNFNMRIVSAIMVFISVFLFWACWKTRAKMPINNRGSSHPEAHDTLTA